MTTAGPAIARPAVLVVGAGFAGSVCARRIAEDFGRRVLVIDRRDHVAGNPHDRRDPHGALRHSYAPHIFRTDSPRVVAFLSRFTGWRPYRDRTPTAAFEQMPAGGFTALVQRLLEHPSVELRTLTDHRDAANLGAARTIWTGDVDEFFGYRFGPLPYGELWQAGRAPRKPRDPVGGWPHRELFHEYQALTQTRPDVLFVGHRARFRALEIDQVVASALQAMDRWTPAPTAAATALGSPAGGPVLRLPAVAVPA